MSDTSTSVERERILPISGNSIWTLLLGDSPAPDVPTVICFHGSGGGSDSWTTFAHRTSVYTRILLYDRAGQGASAKSNTTRTPPLSSSEELSAILKALSIDPPYILVAHSHGGLFAREFLQARNNHVAGIVLAETGQETPSKFEKQQNRERVLGNRPLSVVRANSLLSKQSEVEQALAEGQVSNPDATRAMMTAWDEEDEKLKKEQLKLSTNCRYVHVPDCGHHVIRDRPESIVAEVKWILDQWANSSHNRDNGNSWRNLQPWKHMKRLLHANR